MALTFGFYDSVNGDRTYTAKQFSQFFDGVLSDGVFETIGDEFRVTAASGMIVNVGTGRAWLKSKWVLNDSVMSLQIAASEPILNRIDTVVFAIDEPSRTITITSVKGTPASTPSAPALTNTAEHFEYRIADVYIPATATAITTDNISNFVGTEALPYVLMIMDTLFHSNAMPLADGTGTPGSARTYARSDHRHPTDTTRAAKKDAALTGIPTAPTANDTVNNTQIATTAFVHTAITNAIASKADLASPEFTGNPTAPTQSAGNNSTRIATTAFVKTAFTNYRSTTTATLTVANWSSYQQTVSVSGVTASNLIEVSPAPASYEAAVSAGIYCSAQGAGTLTFKCSTLPASSVTINVVIWN